MRDIDPELIEDIRASAERLAVRIEEEQFQERTRVEAALARRRIGQLRGWDERGIAAGGSNRPPGYRDRR